MYTEIDFANRLIQTVHLIYYMRSDLNPFVHNAPFLYSLKISENHKVFWCIQGLKKECIGNEWVNDLKVLKC